MKTLIVGGVAGGATTAARLRRNDENSEIILFERGEYISYANCGLPYYIGDTIQDREQLFVKTPEEFSKLFNMEVRVLNEVTGIDREARTIQVKNLKTGEKYTEGYDKLVLSPGAEPVRPPIPGINLPGIYTLRNVPDTDTIKSFLEETKPRRAVIVGAGFIGLEMAENLHHQGIFVTIVEMADQVMNILDYEMAAEVHQHLKVKGVEFYLKNGVRSIIQAKHGLTVTLNSGKELDTDMIILSIGVKPDSSLAVNADIKTCSRGGILVDDYLTTNDPDVYALGDAISFKNPITGNAALVPLAGPANKQGRIVADNIAFGNKRTYKGTIATGIAKVFDLTVASTGISEKLAKQQNIEYESIIIHPSSHAGYYPDAIPMSIKALFSKKTTKVLGAQIVGYDGVDKRIDMFAAIISMGGTISDLEELEHAYAPPFSSAKDPVNIIGFIADNIIKGKTNIIQWYELEQIDRSEIFLLDVRTPDEFALGTIEGAVNIPHTEIRDNIEKIPTDKEIILFCGVGLRGYVAERILIQRGYQNVRNLTGGLKTYSAVTMNQGNEDIFDNDSIGKDDILYQTGSLETKSDAPSDARIIEVNACGMQCPGPVLKLKTEMDKLKPGDQLMEIATDPGFAKDVYSWANMTGNKVISVEQSAGKVTALLQKGRVEKAPVSAVPSKGTTLVVFSDDMDKALASFVIANGAAASGKEVTMFFTFWGLNIVKKHHKPAVKKDFMGRMFGMMMAKSSLGLKLSKMNMGGMGTKMMRGRMKAKGVDSLESMIQTASDAGVKMIGCQMSMDIMGVTKEELFDFVDVAGVASYLEAAETAKANLFI
ncbi:MAG: FAD-dependent oxidoreductase [Spirochaetales bacterium]|nr:FAD-dependent oxidoreductase [Spirochaetales bacterium]